MCVIFIDFLLKCISHEVPDEERTSELVTWQGRVGVVTQKGQQARHVARALVSQRRGLGSLAGQEDCGVAGVSSHTQPEGTQTTH